MYDNAMEVTRLDSVSVRGGNGYPLLCYYPGRKITNDGYRWEHGRNMYMPNGSGSLLSMQLANASVSKSSMSGGLVVSLLDCLPRGSGFKFLPGQTFGSDKLVSS